MTPVQGRRLLLVLLAASLIVVEEVIGFRAAASPEPWGLTRTIVHTFTGLSYAVCAWLAWQSADSPIPGRLMITIAFIWLPPPFIAATWPVGALWPLLESVGLYWAILAAVLVAVYPAGRWQSGIERWIVGIAAVGGIIRTLSVLLLATVPEAGCDCAPNAYAFLANDELYGVIDKGFRLLGVTLIIIIIVIVLVRWTRGTTPARNIAFVMPVALVLFCAAIGYESVAYSLGATADALLVYLGYLGVSAIPISFVAGVLYIRSLRGRVSDLMVLTRDGVDKDFWEKTLADTLRDPGLRVYWWEPDSGSYADSTGRRMPGEPDRDRPKGRALMPIDSSDGRLAVIDHDIVLSENGELLGAVSTALRLSVDNGRLREELEATLDEVRESRVRIVEAGILARRQIERDLHDGSQQSLVSVALSLRMAVGRARSEGDEALAVDLEAALDQLSDALRQLRELARGIHPSSLTVGGLSMAIGELVSRSSIPVEVHVDVPRRLPPLTEATVYFFIAECLTNTAKYADARASRIVLEVDDSGLRVSVSDDGRGGADMGAGSGLIGIADRIAAIGGHVEVRSEPGAGTTVTASIPAEALD
ncbi:ATP-binding protein [Rathayibacter sp. YIM 133350]|uniref:sensor histidine kinase n=1 Tax=Rathayibacter sp. YIM 133350 TaxID=3131992 RepID=UPI00307D6957